jgi:hypothetical protein
VWFAAALIVSALAAPDLEGRVVFSGVAVPGASVSATQDGRTVSTTSDEDGAFRFEHLDPGAWTIRVEMRGFVPATRQVTIPAEGPPLTVTLAMRSYEEIVGPPKLPVPGAVPMEEPVEPPLDLPGLVNGSVINGAVTPFAQPRAFGNNRPKGPPLYSGAFNVLFGDSSWNARPYSFGGSTAAAPSYSDLQAGIIVAGPLRIPRVVKYGPQTVASYNHAITHSASTQFALMPTAAERQGDFSAHSVTLRDPSTGRAFDGNVLPAGRIVSQARALLQYYPLPNSSDPRGGNYQAAAVTATTRDTLQVSTNATIHRRHTLAATMSYQRIADDSVGLFGFADAARQSTLDANVNWSLRVSPRLSLRMRYGVSRGTNRVTPFFAHRENVSGDAGIGGNDQNAENWGPPTLAFPAIADLSDAQYQRISRVTHGGGAEIVRRRGLHTVTLGGAARRHTVDVRSQPDPRGTLTFTGFATGDAFADFLLGLPAAASLAFADTGTRLRGASYDAYFNDDWRTLPTLTLNLGVRWEYEAPFTERSGHLVNLDVAPGFSSVKQVIASAANASLVPPDKRGIEPRLGLSWRPSLGSSLVIRAGYGIYRNLGGYESLALLFAQQPPFSRAFNVQTSPSAPLTLANPFPSTPPAIANTFAIDPQFGSASSHTWQVSAQRELPRSLTATVAYTGTTGRGLMQAFLPNTYPAGAPNPCPSCPSGFVYLTSKGSSRRDAAQFTLRRRLHNGFTASAQYTLAKSTDDAAAFVNKNITVRALAVAQNWLDPGAERGPSPFDQRHLFAAQFQYTTGMGVAGGTLQEGKLAAWLKDWTLTSQLTAGSGLPFTPIWFASVEGTGVVGIRPSVAEGSYSAPAPGTWGNSGRNSLRGPKQFTFDAAVARTIPLRGRMNLEWRLAATNVLNRVTFAAVNGVVSSPQFGRPTRANPMRTLQTALRLRF